MTEQEIKSMLENKDIWMDGEEVVKRLEKRLMTRSQELAELEKPKKTPRKRAPAKKIIKKKAE
jgi:hypothetical protein